jgi:hypothetical protein
MAALRFALLSLEPPCESVRRLVGFYAKRKVH